MLLRTFPNWFLAGDTYINDTKKVLQIELSFVGTICQGGRIVRAGYAASEVMSVDEMINAPFSEILKYHPIIPDAISLSEELRPVESKSDLMKRIKDLQDKGYGKYASWQQISNARLKCPEIFENIEMTS